MSLKENLKGYNTITCNGKIYNVKDILSKTQCKNCEYLERRIISLLMQLKKPEEPVVEVLLKKFFTDGYRFIRTRSYSRRRFFNEMNLFLKQYNVVLEPNDERYRLFIKNVLKDTTTGFKKFKIERI